MIKEDAGTIDDELSKDLRNIENYHDIDRLNRYIKYFCKDSQTILEMVEDKVVVFENYQDILENYNQAYFDLGEYLANKKTVSKVKHFYFEPIEQISHFSKQNIYISEYTKTLKDIKLTTIIDLKTATVIDYNNNVKNFVADLKNTKLDKRRCRNNR